MSKFIRNLALFVAGLPFATTKAAAPPNQAPALDNNDKAVSLRPLNLEMDNLFASHRSHSSHASHASHSSHYSGTGGGYSAPPYVAPTPVTPTPVTPTPVTPTPVTPTPPVPREPVLAPAVANGHSSGVAGAPDDSAAVQLTISEKRRLQVLRVQMKLNSLRLYDGQINGTLDEPTRQSIKLFQTVKNLPATGTMTTPTLNALGIPAVK